MDPVGSELEANRIQGVRISVKQDTGIRGQPSDTG